MLKNILLLITILLIYLNVFAGTDPAAFMNAGVGGRASGLGCAYTSISDDTSAVYWNPAGLAQIYNFSISAMGQSINTSKWDTQKDIAPIYQFFSLTMPLRKIPVLDIIGFQNNTLGFGYISNTLGGIPYTYVDSVSGVIVRDSFQDIERAYILSYGSSLFSEESILIGCTIRYITQEFSKIKDAKAYGYDIGVGMIFLIGRTNLGLTLNRGVQMTWANGHKDQGPVSSRLGISHRLNLFRMFSLLGSLDLNQKQNEPLYASIGSEIGYEANLGKSLINLQQVFLRFGADGIAIEDRYGYRDALNNKLNLTLGLGFNFEFWGHLFELDYAFGSYALGDKNRFSINMYF